MCKTQILNSDIFRRFIILEADGEMSPWSRLCVSQADCVLLVAAPDASPEVCPDDCYSSLAVPAPSHGQLCCCMYGAECTQQLESCCRHGLLALNLILQTAFRNSPVHMDLQWILTQVILRAADGQSGTAAAVGDH